MISFGIDIGGTFIKIIAVNEAGKVLKDQQFQTPKHLSSTKFISFLAETKRIKNKKSYHRGRNCRRY